MLFRKMLRDMAKHKVQFISIFIMAFLGVFIFAGVGGEWMGLRNTVNDYYKDTNYADVLVYGNNFSDDNEKAIAAIDGVTGVERCLTLDSIGDFSNDPSVTLHFLKNNSITKPYTVRGEDFSSDDKDGVWIDDRFAKAHKLSIGDTLSVTVLGMVIEKEIKGTVYNPEYVYMSSGEGITPDFSANGYAYLSEKAFPIPEKFVYNELMLTTEKTIDNVKLEEKISDAIYGNYTVFLTRENQPSYAMFNQEIDQHKAMGSIFPIAFLAIAVLTIMTTMTRIVTAQRTQIGTLKAIGFKKGTILRHYISYGFWLSLAGSVLGAIVGPLTLPKLFYPSMSEFYTIPKWEPAVNILFYIMAAVMVLLCTFVTWLACKNVLKDTPAKSLRPKAPKSMKHGFLEKTALWQKFGFNAQWNLRDVVRNKVRSIMAVVGVLGCTALLICAFGMNTAMSDLKVWQYEDINRFASKITVDESASDEQISSTLDKTDGEAIMEGTVEIKANGIKKTGTLTATDNVTLIKATDAKRNYIELPKDGVSLTYKMADILGVQNGDEIKWHIFGDEKWVTTKVDEIYRDPTAQGIRLTKEHLEELGYTFKATSIVTTQKVAEKLDGMDGIMNTKDLTDGWDSLTKAMMMMVYILIIAAAIMAIVVLYNLGLLSFTEMERELATLKVIGLKSKKLRGLLLTQNLWLSAIGFLIGIPCGKWLVDVMVSMSGESFDMITDVKLCSVILSFVITFSLSVFVNLLFSKKIKRIDMVSALKGVE